MTSFLTRWSLALAMSAMASTAVLAQTADLDAMLPDLMAKGEVAYNDNCAACHGMAGEGGGGPTLAKNGFVNGRAAVINQIMFGATDHGMPPFAPVLDDETIAAIATYIRNSWGNEAGIVLPRSVELRRTATAE